MTSANVLRVPALQIRQGPKRTLYSFAVDGKLLPQFTTVSRIQRGSDGEVLGYQRPEVLSHISDICRYLESDDPMIPNALVVAFDERVHFEPRYSTTEDLVSTVGELVIPVDENESEVNKPGWIVDGQQRAAAVREAQIESFPVCVTAFITASDKEQKEQFILVNSTKPLPKGLIYELLPGTEARLPSLLQRCRFPAYLLDRLNREEGSPFRALIKTPTTPEGVIKDSSILKMLKNSLSDGVLYRFRDPATGEGDAEAMLKVVKTFWQAVSQVFETAWGRPPRQSRLMHGAGIVSLGFLMDAISGRYRNELPEMPEVDHFVADLQPIADICRWTDGFWEFGPGAQRKWNEIQNTNRDIRILANYLLVHYRARVWNRIGDQVGY